MQESNFEFESQLGCKKGISTLRCPSKDNTFN